MRQLCFTGTKVDELVLLLCHMLKCKLCCSVHFFVVGLEILSVSCDGREVKALDLKSNGVSPRRFDPCSQRISDLLEILILPLRHKMGISMMYYIQRNMKRLFHSCVSVTTLLH